MRSNMVSSRAGVVSTLLLLGMGLASTERLCGQEPEPPDSLVSIVLTDGTTLRGRIVTQDQAAITLVTPAGIEVSVPRSAIVSVTPIRGRIVGGKVRRPDPNYSRLLLSPTGRPLRKGDGYFSDFYVVFPGISYGVTDNLSLTAGISLIPGVSPTNQLVYVAPRIGVRPSANVAVSAGALFVSVLEEDVAGGIVFGVGTFGPEDASFSAGLGFGYVKENGGDFELADHPVIMLGGAVRLSNGVALVSENWLITGDQFDLNEQPFAVALRFFGERIAVDVGFVLIGEVLDEGVPVPLLSFAYNF